MNGLLALFQRVRSILHTEGFASLMGKILSFAVWSLYRRRTYYVYQHFPDNTKTLDESKFMPRMDDFVLKIVSTNQEADELEADGFEFRSSAAHARRSLDKGAIVFCVFAGKELVHTGWVTLNEEAQYSVNDLPLKVDYAHHEAWTGGTETIPKFGGRGLMGYGYFKRLEYLAGWGIKVTRNNVATDNRISQRVHAKFGPRLHSKASYLRVLFWESWNEKPVPEDEAQSVLNL